MCAIDGTTRNGMSGAVCVHIDCLIKALQIMRYNPMHNMLYVKSHPDFF